MTPDSARFIRDEIAKLQARLDSDPNFRRYWQIKRHREVWLYRTFGAVLAGPPESFRSVIVGHEN